MKEDQKLSGVVISILFHILIFYLFIVKELISNVLIGAVGLPLVIYVILYGISLTNERHKHFYSAFLITTVFIWTFAVSGSFILFSISF